MRLSLALALALASCIAGSSWGLTCPSGWGSMEQEIPEDRINDGYCDCPTNGADEPNTEACAGHEYWPGLKRNDADDEATDFVCPQQASLFVPPSRLNDGICDCCDGADETTGTECPDICDELLAEERAAVARRLENFKIGGTKRAADLTAFSRAVEETGGKLKLAEVNLAGLEKELQQAKEKKRAVQLQWLEDRRATVDSVISATNILQGLSSEELTWVIIHACQMAGEMLGGNAKRAGSKTDGTCVPLRLAGLDASVIWDGDELKPILAGKNEIHLNTMMSLLDYNMRIVDDDANEPVYTRAQLLRLKSTLGKKKKNGRRLTEESYNNHHDDDDEIDEYDEEEEYIDYDEEESADAGEGEEDTDAKNLALIKNQSFSKTRMEALERGEKLIDSINELIDKNDGEQADDGGDSKEDLQDPPIDPMALPMIKKQVERYVKSLHGGLDSAVSARRLLDELSSELSPENVSDGETNEATAEPAAVSEFEKLLPPLAIGTLYHSKLSVLHFWDILAHVIPELTVEAPAKDSCVAPFSCPPRTIQRGTVSIPDQRTYADVDGLCAHKLEELSSTSCGDVDSTGIPMDIPNGFAGYYWIEPRDETDLLQVLFQDLVLTDDNVKRVELDGLEADIEDLEGVKTKTQDSVKEMKDLVSSGEDNKYGPDGELYALKDSCHEIEAGKYTYEICLFGSAKQKEGGSSSGTDLGKWTGADVDDEGGRIWKWENGAKCWNGPKRSATVHLTCGKENKIISSDEPEICKYVFEMESYIACDESFRQLHGLQDL